MANDPVKISISAKMHAEVDKIVSECIQKNFGVAKRNDTIFQKVAFTPAKYVERQPLYGPVKSRCIHSIEHKQWLRSPFLLS